MDLEVGVFDEPAGSAGEGEITKLDHCRGSLKLSFQTTKDTNGHEGKAKPKL
jgi:hypothetical protein